MDLVSEEKTWHSSTDATRDRRSSGCQWWEGAQRLLTNPIRWDPASVRSTCAAHSGTTPTSCLAMTSSRSRASCLDGVLCLASVSRRDGKSSTRAGLV